MAIFNSRKEIENLQAEIVQLKSKVAPEYAELEKLHIEIASLKTEKEKLESQCEKTAASLNMLYKSIQKKQAEIIQLDEEILLQDYALYKPMYDFSNSEQYKDRLALVRQAQKDMVKGKTACNFSTTWTVDGSKAKGQKMINDNIKQILRSFNIECENAIDRVKYSNVDSMRSRIIKSFDVLNTLNQSLSISIKERYLDLKLQELNLAVEYAMKKQEEKEAARQAKEELREQQKLEAEIREARNKILKERNHFHRAIAKLDSQISAASENEKEELEKKRQDLLSELEALDEEEKVIDYREKNAKAGYVYIISNIGSFGKDVYKIGMTRRLEPMDRISELGDASVPFKFDVHALIFSEDAPKLEGALHKAFDHRKINMVNPRKEFFNVSLDEIKEVVRNSFDRTVDFIELPEAYEYRQSVSMKKEN